MKEKLRAHWFTISFIAILVLAIFVRAFQVTQFPPSLYWEEAALGYDAYSILKTGKDHHGHSFPVVAFESFGDYKPAFYFYAVVPSIAVFGLTPLAVRFPSVVAGVFTVVAVGFLAKRLTEKKEWQVLAMFVTAISPWAIEFSRAGWEVNLATCLLTWGMYFGLAYLDEKSRRFWHILLAMFLCALAMFTYHATRVIAPILALVVLVMVLAQRAKKIKTLPQLILQNKDLLLAGIAFLIMISPIVISLGDKSTQQRFAETNIFSDISLVQKSNLYREEAGNSILSKVFYHRFVFYGFAFLENFFKHFRFDFLFVNGDTNPRHSVQFVGQLYLIEVVFLLLGLVYLAKNWRKEYGFLVLWLILGIVPASLTKAAPHALRILPTMPVFMLFITFGVVEFKELAETLLKNISSTKISLIKFSPLIFPAVVCVYLLSFLDFWHFYSAVYPKLYSQEWQYGYQQMVSEVVKQQKLHPDLPVYITREQGRPAMYYWFFTKTDPQLVQVAELSAKKDQGEFLEFQNIKFINTTNEVGDRGIIASSPKGYDAMSHAMKLSEVKNLKNETVWIISEKE
jgi:4-amino-4-deoxy-L-arabinose transferase-like glycosyltransferase